MNQLQEITLEHVFVMSLGLFDLLLIFHNVKLIAGMLS